MTTSERDNNDTSKISHNVLPFLDIPDIEYASPNPMHKANTEANAHNPVETSNILPKKGEKKRR